MEQFEGYQQPQRRATVIMDRIRAITDTFKPAGYVPHRNTEVPYDISVIIDALIEKNSKAMAESLMSHTNLRYEDIMVRNKGD